MRTRPFVLGSAIVAAAAAGAGFALGAVTAARGDVDGAPGVSKALARFGSAAGGGMKTGIAVLAATSTLIGLALYEGARRSVPDEPLGYRLPHLPRK